MNALRRNLLKSAVGAGTVAIAVAAGLLKPTQALAGVPRSAFEARNVADVMKGLGVSAPADSGDITLNVPDIAENGALIPVEITSGIAGTTAIALIAEKNATPLVANFNFFGDTQGFVSTRIKMSQTALIRAVVTADGKSYTVAKEVKVTIGGCGG